MNPQPKRTFSLTSEMKDATLVLYARGWLTANVAQEFKDKVKPLLTAGGHVILDMADVAHIDSSGVGAVVSVYTTSRSVGCKFQICNMMGPVRRIFDVTRLLDAFENCGAYLTKMP